MPPDSVCLDAPDLRHAVEGDHHGDHATCVWCHEPVVFASGRYVTEEK